MASALLLAAGAAALGFRPPAIPLLTTDPYMQTWMRGDTSTSDQVTHWYGAEMQMVGHIRVDGKNYQFLGRPDSKTSDVVQQRSVHVLPTRTIFEFQVAEAALAFNLTFLSTLFADDLERLSRPVYYVDMDVSSLDGKEHAVELYLDLSAQHVVNNCQTQQVNWKSWEVEGTLSGAQIGNARQDTVSSSGDTVNLNWGYLHVATSVRSQSRTSVWAGSAKTARTAFEESGKLPASQDTRQPRKCSDELPVLALTAALGRVGPRSGRRSETFLVAYDEGDAVKYFGEKYKGYWTQSYRDVQHAMSEAAGEHAEMVGKADRSDAQLLSEAVVHGEKYAALIALAYRQTLAATKLVWNHNRSVVWNFLKELSTNGDMQTMDVIYPASPMFLHTNPDLLKLLLQPVLAYANNETYVRFSQPYSPHQLGTYPIGDSDTRAQENMPLENTGNMFFMLLGLIRKQGHSRSATSWFYPRFWPMLQLWADEVVRTAQFPAKQICTDDFEGPLPNNTNLGAKGIVALEAFAELCRLLDAGKAGTDCAHYSGVASRYVQTWLSYAYASTPQPHYKLSYNDIQGIPDSWSLKYNLLWQKLLDLKGPFPWDKLVPVELDYYRSKANKFGVPMDPRHTYVKSDWLSWIAAMGRDEAEFRFFMEPIFDELNTTHWRNPFTDLYDTDTAAQSTGGFIARPVIGGIFAKLLLPRQAAVAEKIFV